MARTKNIRFLRGIFYMIVFSTITYSLPGFSNSTLPQDRSAMILWVFNSLDFEHMAILDEFYHQDAHFLDPVVDAKGLEHIRAHYEHQYKSVSDISFTIFDEHISGDTHTVEWEMILKTKRLNKGKTFFVPGVSVLKFTGNKVSYHRDYFDLGDMVYERVPVLRYITKKIKHRLHFNSKQRKSK